MTDRGFTYRLATPLSPSDRYIATLSVKPEHASVAADRDDAEDSGDGEAGAADEGPA